MLAGAGVSADAAELHRTGDVVPGAILIVAEPEASHGILEGAEVSLCGPPGLFDCGVDELSVGLLLLHECLLAVVR